jgi:hypothetical protein
MIPVVIPVFNNPTYTRTFVNQLKVLNVENIIILDNNSTYKPMLELLNELENEHQIIRLGYNRGPHYALRDSEFYSNLPNYFCLSDPDLELSPNLPENFIDTFVEISNQYKIGKVGFALEVPKEEEFAQLYMNLDGKLWNMREWEMQFWENSIGKTTDGDDLYLTTLDTTFALYNKIYFKPNDRYKSIRVSGKFTAKHLGFYSQENIPKYELMYYRNSTRYSYFSGNTGENNSPVFEISVHEYTKIVEELDSLRTNNEIIGNKLQELNQNLQKILQSRSWKLTSFLRKIHSFLR